jgi:hypothetical protein
MAGPAAPLEARVEKLEEKHQAHDRLLAASAEELERQGRLVARIMRESELALRESHHDIQVGTEMKIEMLRMDLSKQLVDQKYLRKENRALAAFLAAMLFVGWILNKVQVDPVTVVGLVSALLGAVTLAWQHLQKGERKAKDSIAPPKP